MSEVNGFPRLSLVIYWSLYYAGCGQFCRTLLLSSFLRHPHPIFYFNVRFAWSLPIGLVHLKQQVQSFIKKLKLNFNSIRVIFIFQIFSQIFGFWTNIWIYRQRPRFLAKYLLSNISKISEMPCKMNIWNQIFGSNIRLALHKCQTCLTHFFTRRNQGATTHWICKCTISAMPPRRMIAQHSLHKN